MKELISISRRIIMFCSFFCSPRSICVSICWVQRKSTVAAEWKPLANWTEQNGLAYPQESNNSPSLQSSNRSQKTFLLKARRRKIDNSTPPCISYSCCLVLVFIRSLFVLGIIITRDRGTRPRSMLMIVCYPHSHHKRVLPVPLDDYHQGPVASSSSFCFSSLYLFHYNHLLVTGRNPFSIYVLNRQ